MQEKNAKSAQTLCGKAVVVPASGFSHGDNFIRLAIQAILDVGSKMSKIFSDEKYWYK
jgi:hypothetical protein